MPINPNIALGVQPVQQPNMLGQMGQIMAIRAAQQEMEGNENTRNYFAKPISERGDPSQLLGTKQGQAAYAALNKGQIDRLEATQKRVNLIGAGAGAVLQNPTIENFRSVVENLVNNQVYSREDADKAIATIGNDSSKIKAFVTPLYRQAISAEKDLADKTSRYSTNVAAGTAANRLAFDVESRDYDRANPTQHFFTGDDGFLNRVSTRGSGSATQVPMAGSSAPPSQFTISGGVAPITGGAAPMSSGSSIMINPSQAPTGVNYAKVRQPPSSITNVNTFVPASETAQAEFMKGSRATFDQLKQASTVLENIEKAKALIPTAKGFMGTGGETMLEAAKFMNNRLGTSINTEGVRSAEELNTRAFMGILDNLKKLDAQPSQSQQAALKQALGSLSTDPSAMSAVLDVFGDIVRSKVNIYNQEVIGAEERGVKFPYNPVIKLQEKTPANTGDIATDAGIAKIIKSNAEFNALPSGTIFTAPDGTTRRKP